ncbi:MAG: hypothetical protein JEZ01_08855 [Labilibaculum sp.]|nr:hypothetical protein [Labilibaculum sp.]MBI9057872.1 hypothetical protein [Labilibaculum sp.]
MCRKLSLFVYLLLFSFSVSSQEIQNHIFIKNDSIILHQDTLLIGKTILSDILTKSQIDSLGSPIISHWDGDCDSGTDYEYWINKNNYKTVFVKDSKGKYILNAFSLALTNQDSVFLDDYLNVNNLSYKKILALDLKKDHSYRNNDSLEVYRKEGMTLTFYRSKDNLELKLIHIHPKNWDQYLKQKIVKGDVRNAEGESLLGVLFLAYNKFDSLKYYEMTDIDGKYFFEIDSVKEIDVFNFKYEPQTIKILDNNEQTINFKLKKKYIIYPI